MDTPEHQTARFTIHVPQNHARGEAMPSLLDSVRDALTAVGISGRHIDRHVAHDLGGQRHTHDLVHFDAPDDPSTRMVVQTICGAVKSLSGHPGIKVTILPLETQLY